MSLPTNYFPTSSASSAIPSTVSSPKAKKMQLISGPHQDDEKYSLAINIHGVQPEDIAIVCQGSELLVEFEKEFNPNAVATSNWDKSYGIFTRRFSLPADVDTQNIAYSINNGQLDIELMKTGVIEKIAPVQDSPEPSAEL